MVRTGVSGLAGTVVDVTLMVLLVELLDTPYGIAAFCGAATGAGASFLLAKFWAFQDAGPIDPKQFGAYLFVSLGTATFVAVSVHLLAEVAGMQYLAAKGVAASLVFLCWSYPAQSRLVFGHLRRSPAMSSR